MQISVNGQYVQFDDPLSLSALLEQRNWLGKRLAVELNGEIVPKSAYDATSLRDGDRLEIVVAVGGG